ncbi:MAG: NAD(P)H-dependent glycerol-3-phosphate dehydrogenase [Desulfobacterales bacterium]
MEKSDQIQDVQIGVVGAGSWGTALGNLLADKGYTVNLWAYEPEVVHQILYERENKVFLPGIKLSERLVPSVDLSQVVSAKDLLLVVVPSHVMRETAEKFSSSVADNTLIVSASKGIENITHLSMSQVLMDTIPHVASHRFAVLSGPSFAMEVARKVPTLISVASKNQQVAVFIQKVFATAYFRVYTNDDMIGVELGGAIKNVIAIASGIIDGLGLGLNTRAALITRGLTEIRRLGTHMGARPDTFAGLSGIGDLLLTCTGALSRNYTVGKKIGEGKKVKEILSEMRMVAEGVKTAKSVYNLSRKLNVEMPICQEMYRILYEDDSPLAAVRRLMTRDLKHELDD